MTQRSVAAIDRILDAAAACFQQVGLNKTTMSDIIERSGLARTTVYRHFKVKDDIISQLVLRDLSYLTRQLEAIRNEHAGDIEQELIEVVHFTLTEITRRPLLNALCAQNAKLLNTLGLSNEGVMQYIQQAVQPVYDKLKAAGRLREGITLADYAEWNSRFAMSFVVTPYVHQDDSIRMRNYIQNFILPSLLVLPGQVASESTASNDQHLVPAGGISHG